MGRGLETVSGPGSTGVFTEYLLSIYYLLWALFSVLGSSRGKRHNSCLLGHREEQGERERRRETSLLSLPAQGPP